MKYTNEVRRNQGITRCRGFSKNMVALAFSMLVFSPTMGCAQGAPGAVSPSPAPPQTPLASSSTQMVAKSARGAKKSFSHRPLKEGEKCVSDKCHAQMGKDKYVHGPVGTASCEVCHDITASKASFGLTRTGKDLCLGCHEDQKAFYNEKIIHAPVEAEECTGCHDPHQSPYKFQFISGPSSAKLCITCHGDDKIKHKHLHGPLVAEECIGCHNPHASPYQFLLAASPEALCFTCHEEKKIIFKAKFAHKPVKEKCTACHDPHGSEAQFALTAPLPALCFNCHRKINPDLIAHIKNVKVPHTPVAGGECAGCHDPHASNFERFLREGPQEMRLCFKCHNEEAAEIKNARFMHGPIREGLCTTCHDPHGSANIKVLKYFFAEKFYNPYDPKLYTLCFQCHNQNLVKDERTTALTNFRNGDRNLHYLHVHRKKGRTCVACHQVHAGLQERHIRHSTPFGTWKIPMEYTRTPTGGRCVVGCHVPKAYDREKPVKLEVDKAN